MAGIFEGEGCIYVLNQRYNYWYLKLTMCDLDIITRFHELAGCGSVNADPPPKKKNWSQSYTWLIGDRKSVMRMLYLFLPYLGERRKEKAMAALKDIREFYAK